LIVKAKLNFFQTRDFEILKYLIEASPRVISRDEMLDKVWGEDKFPTHRTIDNSILRLRQMIGDSENKYIRSARGVGYQWLISGDPS
jgi:DNA-binding response OmpR family regulator